MSDSTGKDLIVVKLNSARLLLAQVRNAEQAKQVADLARAAAVYARRQQLSVEIRQEAHVCEVDAMTLLGDFLKQTPANPGTRGQLNGSDSSGSTKVEPPENKTPTLDEIGVSKKESAEAQALARLKEKQPDLHEQVRTGKTTVSKARAQVKKEEKREALKRAAQAVPEETPSWRVIHGDTLSWLATPRLIGTPDLIFADPPYNIGVNYGDGSKADRLPDEQYLAWSRQWVGACADVLAKNGSLWLLIGDEYADHFGLMLQAAGLNRRGWIKWYETFGVNCANGFNRCSRHLFYCVKNPRRFTFHADAVMRPSDRQEKYNDPRAAEGGKVWDDVWGIKPPIPRLTGTCAERLPDFPTQLPLALLRPIIGCSSNPGDLVLDPFSGSATTGVAALESGRRFIGIEKQEKFVELSTLRLKGACRDAC